MHISHVQPKSQNHNKKRVPPQSNAEIWQRYTSHEHLFLKMYKSTSLAYHSFDIKYVYRKTHTTFCSQVVVVSTTQFISSFSHITLREVTEKSRYKRNYYIGVGERKAKSFVTNCDITCNLENPSSDNLLNGNAAEYKVKEQMGHLAHMTAFFSS